MILPDLAPSRVSLTGPCRFGTSQCLLTDLTLFLEGDLHRLNRRFINHVVINRYAPGSPITSSKCQKSANSQYRRIEMKFGLLSLALLLASTTNGMTITADPPNGAIVLSGPIIVGDDINLIETSLKFTSPDTPLNQIIINESLGGNTAAALRMARWIRSRNLDLVVKGWCASSCADYLFLAGRRKTLINAIIAYHGSPSANPLKVIMNDIANCSRPAMLKSYGYSDAKLCAQDLVFVIANEADFFAAVGVDQSLFAQTISPERRARLGCLPTANIVIPTIQVLGKYGIPGIQGHLDEMSSMTYDPQLCILNKRKKPSSDEVLTPFSPALARPQRTCPDNQDLDTTTNTCVPAPISSLTNGYCQGDYVFTQYGCMPPQGACPAGESMYNNTCILAGHAR
jgi:hypothetical protein